MLLERNLWKKIFHSILSFHPNVLHITQFRNLAVTYTYNIRFDDDIIHFPVYHVSISDYSSPKKKFMVIKKINKTLVINVLDFCVHKIIYKL